MKVNQLKLGVSEISGSIYLGIPKNSDELKDPVNFSKEFFKTLIIYCSNKKSFMYEGHKYNIQLSLEQSN